MMATPKQYLLSIQHLIESCIFWKSTIPTFWSCLLLNATQLWRWRESNPCPSISPFQPLRSYLNYLSFTNQNAVDQGQPWLASLIGLFLLLQTGAGSVVH